MKEQTMNLMNGELDETMLEDVNGGRCGFLHGFYDGRMNTGKKGWGLFYGLGKALGKSEREKTQKLLQPY